MLLLPIENLKESEVINNSLRQAIEGFHTSWETEIGDVMQSDFLPQIKIKKWGNEVNYSVRFSENFSDAEISVIDQTIKLAKLNKEIHFYKNKFNTYQYHRDLDLKPLSSLGIKSVEFFREPFSHLLINGEIWGRDDENEREIRQESAEQAHGSVLIVGLGLGVINEYLKQNPKVTKITIVEVSSEVINIVKKNYPERLEGIDLIEEDFYTFAGSYTGKLFDYIYGDIFHRVDVANFNAWERFLKASELLVIQGGQIDGRIKYAYETTNVAAFDEDAHEFEIILKEKPLTNKLQFSLQSKGVDFIYQPELTVEEKKEGFIRPTHVIGSYAIYHKSKINNEYQAGKVGHIYRPQIIDAAGNKVWGDLFIDNSQMIVTIPQQFLDDAVYPIRHAAGATFGYTTLGASNTGDNGGDSEVSSQFTGAAGTGVSISVGFASNTAGIGHIAGLYTLSGTTLTFVTGTDTVTSTAALTNAFDALNFNSAPALSAISYNILCMVKAAGKGSHNSRLFDAGSANQAADKVNNGTYPTLPSPITAVSQSTNKYSIFVTYTASGGATNHFLNLLGVGT